MRIIKDGLKVGDQSRVVLKWLGASGRPTEAEIRRGKAIPCHLNIGTHSDCYFGQGVYSDGICREVGSIWGRGRIMGNLEIFYFRSLELSFRQRVLSS